MVGRRPRRVPHARRRDPAGLADLGSRRATLRVPLGLLRYSRDGIASRCLLIVVAVLLRRPSCARRTSRPAPPPPPPPRSRRRAPRSRAAPRRSRPPTARPARPQRLAAVDLRGTSTRTSERLLRFLGLTAGAPFGQADQTRLDAELKALGYRQLATRDRAARRAASSACTSTLEPVRIVRNVVVKRNWPLFDDEIIRHLTLRTGPPLPADTELHERLDEEAEAVRKYLFNEGYFEAGASIEPHIAHGRPAAGGSPRPQWIDLVVKRRPRPLLQAATPSCPPTTTRTARRTCRSRSSTTSSSHWLRFKVSQMRDDARKAEKVLRDAGYPAARVVTATSTSSATPIARPTASRCRCACSSKRKVEVKFVGNRAITPRELRDAAHHLLAPAPSTTSSWPRAPARCQREYQKHGYFEARVTFRRALKRRAGRRRRQGARRRRRGGHLHRRRGARAQGAPRRGRVRRATAAAPSRRPICATRPASRPSRSRALGADRPRRGRLRHAAAAAAGRRAHRQPLQVARLPRRQGALRGGARPGGVRRARRASAPRSPAPAAATISTCASTSTRGGARSSTTSSSTFVGDARQDRARRLQRGAARLPARAYTEPPPSTDDRQRIAQPLQDLGAPATCTVDPSALDVERRRTIASSCATSSPKGRRCASARSSCAATSRRTARPSARICRSSRATSTTSPSSKRPSAICRRTSSSTRRACRRRCSRGAHVGAGARSPCRSATSRPTARSPSPSAPPPTGCPTTSTCTASYLWANFLGYGSQLELRGDFAFLAAHPRRPDHHGRLVALHRHARLRPRLALRSARLRSARR